MRPCTIIVMVKITRRISIEIILQGTISTRWIETMVSRDRIDSGIFIQIMEVSLQTLIIMHISSISINSTPFKVYQMMATLFLAEIKKWTKIHIMLIMSSLFSSTPCCQNLMILHRAPKQETQSTKNFSSHSTKNQTLNQLRCSLFGMITRILTICIIKGNS